MGQNGSSARGRGGPRMSLRFLRRSKMNNSTLSHTFSLPATDDLPELLNINTASEEQLMTLPGINRTVAKAIVEHRQLIGRFKKVDDLALVSGIGAEKLDVMRGEICVSKRSMSRASSCTQSLDSLRTNGDSPRPLNPNTASVFQLQCLPGLNQELAGNIFYHRLKKGPFTSLDDLIKVRGMTTLRLGTIKPYLSLEPNKIDEIKNLLKNNSMNNGTCIETKLENNNLINSISALPHTPGHRKSSSMPVKHVITLANGFAAAPVNDIFDLLSAYSHRPIVEEDFFYERDGVKCIRLGAWNLDQLSLDKVNNPGVREVVCRTILEYKISLLAVQDVESETALRLLCDELNSPMLRRVREWKSNSHNWQFCVSINSHCQKLGFIYDSNYKGITIEQTSLGELTPIDCPGSETQRMQLEDAVRALQSGSEDYEAFFQLFRICGRVVAAVNLQCTASMAVEHRERLERVCAACHLPLAVLAYLNSDNASSVCDKLSSVVDVGVTSLEQVGVGRADILTAKETHTDKEASTSQAGFNGRSGVVRAGLTHLAIPRGWSWGGHVSPHCPVWAEFNLPD